MAAKKKAYGNHAHMMPGSKMPMKDSEMGEKGKMPKAGPKRKHK